MAEAGLITFQYRLVALHRASQESTKIRHAACEGVPVARVSARAGETRLTIATQGSGE